ncbi:hypothetical protein [Streptomyces galbus]|uniref:Uncharacterized protein n=1 Tax=Streptomyces galbus TaxID=33898 RepID=A0A4U5X1K3_STRGB|nr:hypothetical protein [Streptomyces galbus]TKT08232.1 hypothetical protein E4U92_17335 [Streptomyces galbus]GHD45966.1 hypothetical protein GCM10010335_52110 [Streptomyces galbus]
MDHDLVTGGTRLDRGTHGLFLVPPVLLTVARFADASSLARVGGWCEPTGRPPCPDVLPAGG